MEIARLDPDAAASLAGRVVLITGASRGLGAALALEFATLGARLALCARGAAQLDVVADRVRERGARCVAERADVTDPASMQTWVRRAADELGPPDVLVNNASLLGPRVPLADHPLDAWRRVLDVNLTGTLIATQQVLPAMLKRGRGSIINISSGAAVPPRRRWGAYAVSKHALEGMSRNLAAELEGTGVRVNLVDPGAMRTGMRANAYPDEDPATVKPPSATAPAVMWLASDAAAGVSGERIVASG